MSIAACGLDCDICEHHGAHCPGCAQAAGKVFWAEPSGLPACPIYACTAERGHASCAPCKELPCEKWQALREPQVSDEEHAQNLATRLENLRGLG